MSAENRSRRRLFDITEIKGSDPWIPPLIPKDGPPRERLRLIREVLDHNVGILYASYSHKDSGDTMQFPIRGTGFLTQDNGEYFVVTAQHCLNFNFGKIDEDKTSVITTQRKVVIPNGGAPIEVEGHARYFLEKIEQRDRLEDIGIMNVEKPGKDQLEGRGLELMTAAEWKGTPDDGVVYYAGYPTIHGKTLQIRTVTKEEHITQEDVRGSSGGPMFAVVDGRLKVFSLMTKALYKRTPQGQLYDGWLRNEPYAVFHEIVQGLIADSRK